VRSHLPTLEIPSFPAELKFKIERCPEPSREVRAYFYRRGGKSAMFYELATKVGGDFIVVLSEERAGYFREGRYQVDVMTDVNNIAASYEIKIGRALALCGAAVTINCEGCSSV